MLENSIFRKPISDTTSKFENVIVSLATLMLLFKYCSLCGCKSQPIKMFFTGFVLTVVSKCDLFQHVTMWRSSEVVHKRYVANCLLPCALTLSGVSYTSFTHFLTCMKMPFISLTGKNGFIAKIKEYFNPAVYTYFMTMKNNIVTTLQGKSDIKLAGDGQFDSPGYSAKYCVYSMLDTATSLIVDFCVTQRGMYDGELEREGCRELLNKLIDKYLFKIRYFVTDRHSGIRTMMRDTPKFSSILHAFDVWHLDKSISKKLFKLIKAKKFSALIPWIRQIRNHFWYACENCDGSGEKLVEMFHTSLMHICNIHKWPKGSLSRMRGNQVYPKFDQILRCQHDKLSRRRRRLKPFVKRSSELFKRLFAILTKKQLCDDMKHCRYFIHTGAIERYHSIRLKYLPKRIHFPLRTTIVRSMLAIIDHNTDVTNPNKKTKKSVEWSRAAKKYVLKTRSGGKTYRFRGEIMSAVSDSVSNNTPLLSIDWSEYITRDVPENMHQDVTKPALADMVAVSRMSTSGA